MVRAQSQSHVVTVLLITVAVVVVRGGATINEKCEEDFPKVTSCLTYATGGSETPSKECCGAVKDIKDSDPVCLCYVIQQTHNGSAQAKSLGIQEPRLLQLPSACKLANASISDCPKLLKIPPNSPDYAIFANSSASPVPAKTTGTRSASETAGSNGTFKHQPKFSGAMAVAMAIFFHAFPVGFVPMFYTRR
ncbi:non-specific lipid transfer protein GPI-anchored 1-like [Cornus florida]|uniref:non-specific lipid transfer protein GPI-anchored 1-like n=1 Tax=Cornus florida TaxID=4283 RepID=UPI00289A210A|nr:non-specific lipid transfer protein GPI-anchored 1-like [Cornus florida]